MLLRLQVENWKSFRDATTLNMVADNEVLKHTSRVVKTDAIDEGILPVAALFGGNAAGKSNLFSAISFIRRMVIKSIEDDALIDAQPFRLDRKSNSSPSSFSIDVLTHGTVWSFAFSVDSEQVLEERLSRCDCDGAEHLLYSRSTGTPICFAKEYSDEVLAGLRLLENGTKKNQLFVNNTLSQNFPAFQAFGAWFKNLLLLEPESHPISLQTIIDDGSPFPGDIKNRFIQWLRNLDTGILKLNFIPSSIEEMRFSSSQERNLILKKINRMKNGETLFLTYSWEHYSVTKDKETGGIAVEKLIATHSGEDGNEVPFNLQDESSGTLRLIELLPAFLELTYRSDGTELILIVDEIDRSLHTWVTRELIEEYLRHRTPQSRSQLLFTTHDILLLDPTLFRNDEIWFVERDKTGASNLIPLNAYEETDAGEDIRIAYLQGSFGGIPLIKRNNGSNGEESEK